MALNEKFRQALARLEESAALAAGPQTVVVDDQQRQLRCKLFTLDRVGCAVDHLSAASQALANASIAQLEAIGQELASRLTYLLEPIAVIEADSDAQTVQMRSQPPLREERTSTYYELVVGRGRLELRRYVKEPGAARRSVVANLTREVLLRLSDDMVAAAE